MKKKMKATKQYFPVVLVVSMLINPIQTVEGGGGGWPPHWLWGLVTFFYKQARPTKLGDFS